MKAEIVSIGTELLMGELTDTNASLIASRLPPLGIQLQWVSQVGDNLDMLADVFTRGLSRSDIIFSSGGLGPTQDDLTREAISKALGEEMVVQEEMLAHLREFFRGRGTEMPATNIKQATLIPSAQSIPNRRGTAPGWWVEPAGNDPTKIIVAMPGPPSELEGIWEEEVVPRLRQKVRGEVILTRNIKTTGLSEGGLDEMVSQYLGKDNPYLGIYAKPDGIHLRIIARASNEEQARKLIQPVEEGLASIVGPYIWGYDDETPEEAVGLLLSQRSLTIATMETCTGGLLANSITGVPASAGYFKGGVIIYDHQSAMANHSILEGWAPAIEKHGIVSKEAAGAMAQAVKGLLNADVGIGVTGVAGPDEIEGKPVGLVHIAIALPTHGQEDDPVQHFTSRWPPRRTVITRRAASTALIELRRLLSAM